MTTADKETPPRDTPEAFAAWLDTADDLTARRETVALFPYLATLPAAEVEVWRAAVSGRGKMRAATFDELLTAERAKLAGAEDADSERESDGPAPEHAVNVTGPKGWRYSVGGYAGEHGFRKCPCGAMFKGDKPHCELTFTRALYEKVPGGIWRKRADLPHVHARIVRRDGSRRRIGTDFLVSATEDGPRVMVARDELKHGEWAGKLGVPLSLDRDIVDAAGTAIMDMASRAPEQEATPPLDADASGKVVLAAPECLPDGYLRTPSGVDSDTMRAVMREAIEVIAKQPGGMMALAMGASAASPFIGPARRDQSFWVDIYGDSRKGKSTTLAVAASLWGDPRKGGIIIQWNASSIGTNRHLGQLGILPPFIDERGISGMGRDEVGALIYSTCEGASRLTAERLTHGTRRSPGWFGVFFSTGNARATDGITSGPFAGVPARVIELAAPLTEDETTAKRITRDLLPQCFGWLGPEIVATYTVSDLEALLDAARSAVGVPTVEGVPSTIAGHLYFAVAGAFMIDEVAGTGNTLADAAIAAAREYLAAHDMTPEHDADRMLNALAEEMAGHRSAWPTIAEVEELDRPEPLYNDAGMVEGSTRVRLPQRGTDRDVDGWRSNDDEWLYVRPETWRRLVEAHGLDLSVTCEELHKRGLLHVPASYRKRRKYAAPSPRIGGRKTSCYTLRMSALDAERADDGADETTATAERPASAPETAPAANDTRQAASDRQAATQAPEPAAASASSARSASDRPEIPYGRASAKTTARQDAQAAARATVREAIDNGRPLRLLAALEGPFMPLRNGRKPYWQPELPMPVGRAFAPNGFRWERPYSGDVVSLDRSGAWVSAASSVEVVHGAYEHTGAIEWTGRPGYYLVTRYPWHEADMPDPLGNERGETALITSPVMSLLADLVKEGRWPDIAVLDSWTGDPVRLRDWAKFCQDAREYAITKYGRGEGSPYDAVKENFGMAFSLMTGKRDGTRRVWVDENGKSTTKVHRTDWKEFVQSHATVMLWRYADDMRKILPKELAPVALRDIDEIVLPADALDIVTTTNRPGGRKPIQIDPDGIRLGTFKVKRETTWGDNKK